MNRDIPTGKWRQFKGVVKRRWRRLTDADLDQIAGSHEKLVGRLQEAYGKRREAAELEVSDFFNNASNFATQ